MKKSVFLISCLVFIVLTSEVIYNYKLLNFNFNGTPPYHYLSLSEMPRDIQNNSLPIVNPVSGNFDNMPLSVGLNGAVNTTTDAGATLGRVIFYDRDLSINKTIACADCHKQQFSFTDTARLSYGWQGPLGPRTFRNSMNLNHTRFHKSIRMFWDLRASSIEDQVTQPMRDAVEMGMSLIPNNKAWDTITGRMRAKSFYPVLFQKAFGATTIDSQRIALALAQFVRSMNTFNSKFRKALDSCNCNAENAPLTPYGFTAQEQLGRDLFMDVNRGNCQACHTRFIFVPQGAQNNGADGSVGPGGHVAWTAWGTRNDYVGKDSGLAGYRALGRTVPFPGTNWQRDTGKIKANIGRMAVPSLINVGLTAPYFHDGRYKTLDQVINFYSDSIKNNDYNTLSLFFRKFSPSVPGAPNNVQDQAIIDTAAVRVIHYTPTEKAALKAFLLTMTDTSIFNPRWSTPFAVLSGTVLKPVLNIENASTNKSMAIMVNNGEAFTGSVSIYSIDGKLLRRRSTRFDIGGNYYNFDGLPKGEYIVRVNKGASSVESIKMIL